MEYDEDFERMVEAQRRGTVLAIQDIARPRRQLDLGDLFFRTVLVMAVAALAWTWLAKFLFGG